MGLEPYDVAALDAHRHRAILDDVSRAVGTQADEVAIVWTQGKLLARGSNEFKRQVDHGKFHEIISCGHVT